MDFSRSNASELLMRGVVAARTALSGGKTSDYEEAEFYLEWVLRTDPEEEQQVEALYWLSRVVKDPARQRECLQEILSISPSHTEARRDLAVLEGRLKPDAAHSVPGTQSTGVLPGEQAGEVKRLKCPKCGAALNFPPDTSSLKCQICGAEVTDQGREARATGKFPTGQLQTAQFPTGQIAEQDWATTVRADRGRLWALPLRRVMKCQGCGASLTFSPVRLSARCPYCGSALTPMAVGHEASELREPDGMVIFAFDARAAMEHARTWLASRAGQAGITSSLATLATLQAPNPVLLPFWQFTVGGEVRWHGRISNEAYITSAGLGSSATTTDLGHTTSDLSTGNNEPTMRAVSGLSPRITGRGGVVYAEGTVPVAMENLLVPATASLPAELLASLKYDTRQAPPYRPELLVNWPAEVYKVSAVSASRAAREAAVAATDKAVEALTKQPVEAEDSSISVDRSGMTLVSHRLLLLPAWTSSYTFKNETYRLLINGQNGQVEGDLPGKTGLLGRIFSR